MTDEEIKPEGDNPAPASGDEPQEEPVKADSPETPDYKAEAEQKEKELKEREEQLRKAGFTIQKLKDKMKEEGIELGEGQGLSEEQVESIITKVVGEELGKSREEIQGLKTQLGEVLKSIGSKGNLSKGGGEGGQKPPKEEGIPRPTDMSPDELTAVEGCDWDSKKGGWVDRETKQFYPHKREVLTPQT